jgi:hypothetical protein
LQPYVCFSVAIAEPPTVKFTGRDCQEPVRISNTTGVLIESLTIVNEKPLDKSPIELCHDNHVVIRNATVRGTAEGIHAVVSAEGKKKKRQTNQQKKSLVLARRSDNLKDGSPDAAQFLVENGNPFVG